MRCVLEYDRGGGKMTWPQRLMWSGIYGFSAVLLWLLGDHITAGDVRWFELTTRGAAALGMAYLAAIVCAVLSLLAFTGRLPRIPEDEPY